MSIPWIHVGSMTPFQYHESMSMPWVQKFKLLKKKKKKKKKKYGKNPEKKQTRTTNYRNTSFINSKLSAAWKPKYKLQIYQSSNYRNTNFRNSNIQITEIQTYKLEKWRNTYNRKTEIQVQIWVTFVNMGDFLNYELPVKLGVKFCILKEYHLWVSRNYGQIWIMFKYEL